VIKSCHLAAGHEGGAAVGIEPMTSQIEAKLSGNRVQTEARVSRRYLDGV